MDYLTTHLFVFDHEKKNVLSRGYTNTAWIIRARARASTKLLLSPYKIGKAPLEWSILKFLDKKRVDSMKNNKRWSTMLISIQT